MWHFKKNLRSYLEIHFITLASNFALYYFQITFSSFKLVIWHSRLSKLCLSLDFKSIFLNKFNKKFVLFCNMNMASWLAGRSTIDWRRRREYKIDSITSVKTSYIYTCNMSLTCNYGLFDNICSPSWVAESLRVPSHGGVISIGRKIVTSKSQNLSTIFCYIQFPNHFLNTMLKISSNFDWNGQSSWFKKKKNVKKLIYFVSSPTNDCSLREAHSHMEQSLADRHYSVVKINKNQNGFSNLHSQHTYALQNYWFLGGYVF